jgi:FkbM family methyltransferase
LNLHRNYKALINRAAGLFGARVVGAHWGPRGVPEVLTRIKLRGFRPTLVIDVGASNGQWTRECQAIFSNPRYILVDPLDVNRAPLEAMARADARIIPFFGVAGAHTGTLTFHDHGDQSSILPSDDFPGVARSVEATTVDMLFAAHGPAAPVLLKADVQGYELEVLKGAASCLASTEVIVIEVSFRKFYKDSALAHEIVAFLGERGFRIYEICSYLQRATDQDLLQSDFVFVHESSSLLSHQGWN